MAPLALLTCSEEGERERLSCSFLMWTKEKGPLSSSQSSVCRIQRLSLSQVPGLECNAWNGNMVELLIKGISLISEEYPSFRVYHTESDGSDINQNCLFWERLISIDSDPQGNLDNYKALL